MKRAVVIALAALALVVGFAVSPAHAAWYWFQVQDEQGRALTGNFTCQVYTAATQAQDVVFADPNFTTQKTNPVVPDSNGVCAFATDATTVDVTVWGTTGRAQGAVGRMKSLADTDHRLLVDTNTEAKHLRFFWDASISKGAEVDTGIDLPLGALVDDVFVEVATGRAMASISVGLLSTEASGDTDGFCKSQGTDFGAAPGQYFRCEASRTLTAMGTHWIIISNTRGVLIGRYVLGNKTALVQGTDIASEGQVWEYSHIVQAGAAQSIVYQTKDIGSAAGYVHIFYRELRGR